VAGELLGPLLHNRNRSSRHDTLGSDRMVNRSWGDRRSALRQAALALHSRPRKAKAHDLLWSHAPLKL